MEAQQNISSDLRDFFSKKFSAYQEIWEENYLSFICKLNTFTLKIETPIQRSSKGKLLLLRNRQLNFFLLSDYAPDKRFEWRSSRMDLNMSKVITERLSILHEFTSQIQLCSECGKAHPFPYLTGIRGSRRNDKSIHYFQLRCPCCGAIFNPTKDYFLEKRCNQILKNTRGTHTIKKEESENIFIVPSKTVEKPVISKGANLLIKEVVIGMHQEDSLNPHFKIVRKKSCELGMEDFKESELPGKLACMFFQGAHLKLEINKSLCTLEATEVMDCKLTRKNKEAVEMKPGIKHELDVNIPYALAIDDILYTIMAVA